MTPGKVPFTDYDQQLAELKDKHPGWQIWYVPHLNGPTVFCAQPLPLLNCASAEELHKAISDAQPGAAPSPR